MPAIDNKKDLCKNGEGEQMISYEIIYEPNTVDAHGEWCSEEALVKAQANYEAAYRAGLAVENLFHLGETDSFTIVKTWIQPEFDVIVKETGELIKAGSWVAKVQYNDPDLWELKKAGVVGGLSVQCSALIDHETNEIIEFFFDLEEAPEEDEGEE